MSPVTRLLLVPAALALWCATAVAKDIPGLPKELINATFAENLESCRAYFNSLKTGRIEDQSVESFGEKNGTYTYGDCDIACYAAIQSYRTVKNGYVVKMRWIGSGGNRIENLSITKLGGNKFRFSFLPKETSQNRIRCPKPEDRSALEQ